MENRGNLTSSSNISNHIIVGIGHNISVLGHGNAFLPNSQTPLKLNHVLCVPKFVSSQSLPYYYPHTYFVPSQTLIISLNDHLSST